MSYIKILALIVGLIGIATSFWQKNIQAGLWAMAYMIAVLSW